MISLAEIRTPLGNSRRAADPTGESELLKVSGESVVYSDDSISTVSPSSTRKFRRYVLAQGIQVAEMFGGDILILNRDTEFLLERQNQLKRGDRIQSVCFAICGKNRPLRTG